MKPSISASIQAAHIRVSTSHGVVPYLLNVVKLPTTAHSGMHTQTMAASRQVWNCFQLHLLCFDTYYLQLMDINYERYPVTLTHLHVLPVLMWPPLQPPSAVFNTLGAIPKARQSLHTMFSLAHRHGDILREGWKNILDCLLTLFKAKLLPDCLVEVRNHSPCIPAMPPIPPLCGLYLGGEEGCHRVSYFMSCGIKLQEHKWSSIEVTCLICTTSSDMPPGIPSLQVEDFLHPEGKVSLYREEAPARTDSSLLSSLYSYWLLSNDSLGAGGGSGGGKNLSPSEVKAQKVALKCVKVSSFIVCWGCWEKGLSMSNQHTKRWFSNLVRLSWARRKYSTPSFSLLSLFPIQLLPIKTWL